MDVEHYLRRGRPLAAFSSLLSLRAHKSGSFNPQPGRQSSYDPQSILSNITETEESLITSVRQFFLYISSYAIGLLGSFCGCGENAL